MADDARQPVAIRIARPYASEEAFLENELDTLTRTSVILIGAQSRPQGVVLRFEVTLASGAPLLRGEGRVVGFKANALGDEPGLTLRFTRLDPRSKALVDRAAGLRDARARGARSVPPAPPSDPNFVHDVTRVAPPPQMRRSDRPPPAESRRPSSRAPLGAAVSSAPKSSRGWREESPSKTTAYDREALERLHSERLAREASEIPPPTNAGGPLSVADSAGRTLVTAAAAAAVSERPPPTSAPPPPRHSVDRTPAPPTPAPVTAASSSGPATEPPPHTARRGPVEPPPDRNALLDRLRARARALPEGRVREILAARHA